MYIKTNYVYFSAQKESPIQTTEDKTTTLNGNNESLATTATDGSLHEDGQGSGIQGRTHLDQHTELTKKSPYSSKGKGKKHCKMLILKRLSTLTLVNECKVMGVKNDCNKLQGTLIFQIFPGTSNPFPCCRFRDEIVFRLLHNFLLNVKHLIIIHAWFQ